MKPGENTSNGDVRIEEMADASGDPVAERQVNGGAMATKALLLMVLAMAAACSKKTDEPQGEKAQATADLAQSPTATALPEEATTVKDIIYPEGPADNAPRLKTFESQFVHTLDLAANGELTPSAMQQMKNFVASKVECNPADLQEKNIAKRPEMILHDRMIFGITDEELTSRTLTLNGKSVGVISAVYHQGKDVGFLHQVPLNKEGTKTETRRRTLWPECVVIERYEFNHEEKDRVIARFNQITFDTAGKMPFLDSVEILDSTCADEKKPGIQITGQIWRDKKTKKLLATMNRDGVGVFTDEAARDHVRAAEKFMERLDRERMENHGEQNVEGTIVLHGSDDGQEGEEFTIGANGVGDKHKISKKK